MPLTLRASRLDGFVCPVCGGGEGRTRYSDGEWRAVRCDACSLLSTWPRPAESALAEIYDSPGYFGERWMAESSVDDGRARVEDILARAGRGPWLDFGAGSGHLVSAARSLGVDADGVEPAAPARRIASDLYGTELLPELPVGPAGRYHVVTMIHVLEHLPDPVQALRDLSDVVEPGGTFFLEVPHAGSAPLLLPSERRAVYDLPAHLFHFTPTTLADVVTRAGLAVESVRLYNPWFLERLLALRGRTDESAAVPATAQAGTVSSGSAPGAGPARTLWRGFLPRVRTAMPGQKFQMLASRR